VLNEEKLDAICDKPKYYVKKSYRRLEELTEI
jgi:hypothetical protein